MTRDDEEAFKRMCDEMAADVVDQKRPTWEEIDQLEPDDEPLTEEELRQLNSDPEYMTEEDVKRELGLDDDEKKLRKLCEELTSDEYMRNKREQSMQAVEETMREILGDEYEDDWEIVMDDADIEDFENDPEMQTMVEQSEADSATGRGHSRTEALQMLRGDDEDIGDLLERNPSIQGNIERAKESIREGRVLTSEEVDRMRDRGETLARKEDLERMFGTLTEEEAVKLKEDIRRQREADWDGS
ncbi:hypothetical protein [Paenibacillus cremeus]|uniref:Uncharacterized protein n=1 Tax=Paenibacillus cremeus TaxID=2163881 RepID=A0A559K477_9BACL|nr:hypothetical protein [Paenibacillus cremeus]TVY06916.1 hypothetical protein FPZ49_26745 [Paenibacillus cremeus]